MANPGSNSRTRRWWIAASIAALVVVAAIAWAVGRPSIHVILPAEQEAAALAALDSARGDRAIRAAMAARPAPGSDALDDALLRLFDRELASPSVPPASRVALLVEIVTSMGSGRYGRASLREAYAASSGERRRWLALANAFAFERAGKAELLEVLAEGGEGPLLAAVAQKCGQLRIVEARASLEAIARGEGVPDALRSTADAALRELTRSPEQIVEGLRTNSSGALADVRWRDDLPVEWRTRALLDALRDEIAHPTPGQRFGAPGHERGSMSTEIRDRFVHELSALPAPARDLLAAEPATGAYSEWVRLAHAASDPPDVAALRTIIRGPGSPSIRWAAIERVKWLRLLVLGPELERLLGDPELDAFNGVRWVLNNLGYEVDLGVFGSRVTRRPPGAPVP